MSAIGIDGRVTGAQRYSVDIERPGMLHAAFVRSPHPHARVLSVDASALPEGCVALTPDDVADLGLTAARRAISACSPTSRATPATSSRPSPPRRANRPAAAARL